MCVYKQLEAAFIKQLISENLFLEKEFNIINILHSKIV